MYPVRITIRKPKDKLFDNLVDTAKTVDVDVLDKIKNKVETLYERLFDEKDVLNDLFENNKYITIEVPIETGYWLYKNFGERSKIYVFFLAIMLTLLDNNKG
jgi:hypothetical protein